MRLDQLMWLCGGLFILFGLPLLFLDDKNIAMPLAGLSVVSLGCFGLAMAGDGVKRGEIKLHPSTVKKSNQPTLFWLTVALVAAAGLGCIVTGIWFFFFKGR